MIRQLKFVSFLICMVLAIAVKAQDIHFSQYNSSPFNLNPALAGNYDGRLRFIGNHRRQWIQISPDGIPYSTQGLSVDAKNLFGTYSSGLSVYNDVDGYSKLQTFKTNLVIGKTISLLDSTSFLSIGGIVSYTQKSIDYSNLSFNDQYDGFAYNPNLGTDEILQTNSLFYIDFALGVAYKIQKNNDRIYSFGVSLFNITKPNESFVNGSAKLDRRFNFHAKAEFKINEKITAIPSYLFMAQGKFIEFDIGGAARYKLDETINLYGGIFGRTKDAGYLFAGIDYNQWHVGVSYDFNLSDLKVASNARGGLELAVIYIIKEKPPKRLHYKSCPDFL